MRLQRLHLLVFGLALLLTASACGEKSASQPAERDRNGQRGGGQRGGRGGPAEVTVRTTSPQRISIQRQIEVSGTLASIEQVKISSEVAGIVKDAPIELGQEVQAGQILVQIDSRELDLAKERAESALRQTEAQLGIDASRSRTDPTDDQIASVRTATANRDDARQKLSQGQELVGKGLMPRADLETLETRVKVAEANLQAALENVRALRASLQDRRASVRLAQKKIEDAAIRAPVTGAISERLVQRGEYVRENTQVATIVQLNPLQLRASVQEKFASLVRTNLPVQFSVEPYPNQMFVGKIANISPTIDQQTRTFPVEVQLQNANHRLKPGFFANGVILTGRDSNVLAVAEEAVSILAGVSSVYVVENGQIRQQSVMLGTHEGKFFEILDGLKGDEMLAVSNLSQLVTGTHVVLEGNAKPGPATAETLP